MSSYVRSRSSISNKINGGKLYGNNVCNRQIIISCPATPKPPPNCFSLPSVVIVTSLCVHLRRRGHFTSYVSVTF